MFGSKNVPRSAISLEFCVGDLAAACDRRAPRTHGSRHGVSGVSVDPSALARRPGFAAGGLDLLIGHCPGPALANALGREDLDEIGSVSDEPAHSLPDRLRVARVLVDRRDRGEQARPRELAASDRLAQIDVGGRSDALNGGKASHQRDAGVLGRVEDRLRGGLALGELHVRSSQNGWISVRACRSVRVGGSGHGNRDWRDSCSHRPSHDARAFDDNRRTGKHVALAIDDGSRSDDETPALAPSPGGASTRVLSAREQSQTRPRIGVRSRRRRRRSGPRPERDTSPGRGRAPRRAECRPVCRRPGPRPARAFRRTEGLRSFDPVRVPHTRSVTGGVSPSVLTTRQHAARASDARSAALRAPNKSLGSSALRLTRASCRNPPCTSMDRRSARSSKE